MSWSRAGLAAIAILPSFLHAQGAVGELRLRVSDEAGLPAPSSVEIVSQVNQVRQRFDTDAEGAAVIKRLAFGMYRIQVEHAGFAPVSELIEIRSAIPKEYRVTLHVAPIQTAVVVEENGTLLDPHRTSSSNRLGAETLQDRPGSSPGRSLLELVNTQPGWLVEANGILHPRGSEYQTQYVVDGIPLTENRSPAFSSELDADEVQSMSILTAGYPAEFGRKLGGVIEIVTARDSRPGFHGRAAVGGGSFGTLGGDLMGQYGWGRNTLSASANVARTDRYLDPPVEQNYSNAGTNASFSTHYERDLTDRDRVGFILRRAQSRFSVPNEQVQQQAGQRQDRGSEETGGQFSYQHVFSPNIIGDLRGMVRDLSALLWSNSLATPIIVSQDRGLRESYVKGSTSMHFGRHEWKAGAEADFGSIHEALSYRITDRSQFDPETRRRFDFLGRAQDREQALFVQDLMRFGNLTVSAGLRWDHYRLLVDDQAVSPRLGVAWYWPSAGIVLRGSYDRIFQTPAFENLLLASSASVDSLNDSVVRLPVAPSRGHFLEAGFSKSIFSKMRLDANYYHRSMDNAADDDLLLNTGVSFPIAFARAEIHGVETKLEIPRWGPFSGFVSYSNMYGTGHLPVTGGLFLGDDAAQALNSRDRFPVSQDQRNTVQSRFRYQVSPRVWAAMGASYGSGLPVEFDGSYAQALAQYGIRIVDRVNFDRGRVRPSFALNASAGVVAWKKERRSLKLQVDSENLTDRLNVINFAGVFSGTALAAPRSFSMRLVGEF